MYKGSTGIDKGSVHNLMECYNLQNLLPCITEDMVFDLLSSAPFSCGFLLTFHTERTI